MMATEKQIEGNRANRQRWHGHTQDGLERLREAARKNKPWRRSTGPRTAAGKNRSKNNAFKHGGRSAEAIESRKEINRILREMRERFR